MCSRTPAALSSRTSNGFRDLQEYFWKEEEVNARLNDIITRAFRETSEIKASRETSMRVAAYGLAVRRVAEATITRGPIPRVVLYTAEGCHLCERALEVVDRVCAGDFEHVDIGGDPSSRPLPCVDPRRRDRR